MESKAKILGHPIHPMLIVIPLGLFVAAVIVDIVYLTTGNTSVLAISHANIGIGVIGGLLAAVFGLIDWLKIPAGTRAKSIGLLHGLGNVVVTALFGVSWLMRQNAPNYDPGTAGFVLSFAGILLGAVTGWLGGELVDRLAVGVDRGAHLNSPSSLSGQPADANRGEGGRAEGSRAGVRPS